MSLGLPNFGNTCYINSIIQCLRYQRNFVTLIKNYKYDHDSEFHKDFIDLMFAHASNEVLQSFIQLLSEENKEFALWKQCDAHELFIFLIDSFYEKHSLENPFQGEFMQTITCLKCFHISSTKQKFNTLSLPITEEKNTEDLIKDFEKEETVQYNCEKCNHNQCQKKVKIYTYPSTLVVHLKRFNGNNKIDTSIKLDNFLSYKLTAVCNHSGNTSAGHYTAAVKKSNGYLMISDNVCNEVSKLPEKSKFPYLLFFERYKRKRIL